jgi:hypothetical protein
MKPYISGTVGELFRMVRKQELLGRFTLGVLAGKVG